MATLYQTVNDDLPTTSSLKMIDIWMLFALAIPFMEVILHTAMAWIRQKHKMVSTKEVVDIIGGNQTDEIYGREAKTPTARSGANFEPQKSVVKRLIKEAIKEAVIADTIEDVQDQPGENDIDTKGTKRPIMRKIAWDQKDERTWPKRILRYFNGL